MVSAAQDVCWLVSRARGGRGSSLQPQIYGYMYMCAVLRTHGDARGTFLPAAVVCRATLRAASCVFLGIVFLRLDETPETHPHASGNCTTALYLCINACPPTCATLTSTPTTPRQQGLHTLHWRPHFCCHLCLGHVCTQQAVWD